MTEMGVIPYSFKGITEYPRSQQLPALPGQAQGVSITLASTDFQFILNKMIGVELFRSLTARLVTV